MREEIKKRFGQHSGVRMRSLENNNPVARYSQSLTALSHNLEGLNIETSCALVLRRQWRARVRLSVDAATQSSLYGAAYKEALRV